MKRYSELMRLPTYRERYEYLRFNIPTDVGNPTKFRYLNQRFYHSEEWFRVCREVIVRDGGCDLGLLDRVIYGRPRIHHINPLTLRDFETSSPLLLDLENLITTSFETHKAIHYGNRESLFFEDEIRRPNDTCPWKEA